MKSYKDPTNNVNVDVSVDVSSIVKYSCIASVFIVGIIFVANVAKCFINKKEM